MENYQKALSNGESFSIPADGRGFAKEVIAASATLTADQCGKVLQVATDALTITLPATVAGLIYIVQNTGADGAVAVTLSPNASDKIMGSYSSGGILTSMSGTDDKDIVNTKATANKGDYIVLEGDGSDGWYIRGAVGIWTEEDQTAINENPETVETVSDNKVLTAADSGKTFLVDTDAKTMTLPATVSGLVYTFVNDGADGAVALTVSPNASDKIMGSISNGKVLTSMTGTDNKDIVNTKATANNGDKITLIGDGSLGWYIVDGVGIWTEEDQTAINENPSTAQDVTEALVLTANDNGKTLYLNAAAGAAITLPAPAAGLKFKFVTKLAFATTPWTIGTNAGADIIEGGAIVNSTFVAAANEDQIEFDESAETIGDYVELESDGTSWFCNGVGAGAGSIVFTAT